MKRLLAVLLVAMVVLAGCGSEKVTSETIPTETIPITTTAFKESPEEKTSYIMGYFDDGLTLDRNTTDGSKYKQYFSFKKSELVVTWTGKLITNIDILSDNSDELVSMLVEVMEFEELELPDEVGQKFLDDLIIGGSAIYGNIKAVYTGSSVYFYIS